MYLWHYSLVGDRCLPPLVFLHGWMGCCEDYDQIIELLRSQYYCISIDLPGHGTTSIVGDDRGYEFISTALGIIQLLDSLSIDMCTLYGYSFGGRLALYLGLEFRGRFDRIILESTSPGFATVEERQARIIHDEQITHRLSTEKFSAFINTWYRQSIFIGIERHSAFPSLIQRRLNNQPANLAKSLKYAGLGKQPYLGERLKAFGGEILLIVGEEDLKFRSIAQTLDEKCDCISLSIVPNCSHNIHFQVPELIYSLLITDY